jgi:hypothetical protein
MNCDNCDGYGWLYLDDFREVSNDEERTIIGDDHSIVFVSADGISLCPDCDGTGIEEDEDYAENLEIIKKIDSYMNHRGFDWAYMIDFDERKARKVFYFQWRTRRWNLLTLSATVPGLFED